MTSLERSGFVRNKASEPTADIYGFSAPLLDGRSIELSGCRGHVVLIVNTASRCGFTPQYAGLEQLYRAYKERGLLVFGFPCNQFGAQEPGSADDIGTFCQQNYGVSFPVFAKIEVNGPGAHPLYDFLKHRRRGLFGTTRIKWNFTKFLVDRKGHVVARYAPATRPEALIPEIERLLAEPV
jgi:glutathione peroxidase